MVDYISQGHIQSSGDLRLIGFLLCQDTDDTQTVYVCHGFDKIKDFMVVVHISLP